MSRPMPVFLALGLLWRGIVPALAADSCAPLQQTNQYARCLTDQLSLLSAETAAMQEEARARGLTETPAPVYRINPDTPFLSPYQDGYAAQQRGRTQNLQRSLNQRSLQLQQGIGRASRPTLQIDRTPRSNSSLYLRP